MMTINTPNQNQNQNLISEDYDSDFYLDMLTISSDATTDIDEYVPLYNVRRSVFFHDSRFVSDFVYVDLFDETSLKVGTNKFIPNMLFHLEEQLLKEFPDYDIDYNEVVFAELQGPLEWIGVGSTIGGVRASADDPFSCDLFGQYEEHTVTTLDIMRQMVSKHFGDNSTHADYCIRLLEDVFTLLLDISYATEKWMYVRAVVNFIRLRTNKSTIFCITKPMISYLEKMLLSADPFGELQGEENPLSQIRQIFENFEEFQETKTYEKVYKFMMYAMSCAIFEEYDLDHTSLGYSRMEARQLKLKHSNKYGFAYVTLDCITFLASKGYQCYKLGSMSPFFHSSSTYAKWVEECEEIKLQSQMLTNSDMLDVNRFEYSKTLERLIEEGQSIVKFADKKDKKFAAVALNQLKMIKVTSVVQKSISSKRKAPFACLIAGASSVGKSTLVEAMFVYYAKLFKLPVDDEYIFYMNPFEEFMNGFGSYKHTLIMDDVAFIKPSVAQGVDTTISAVLQLLNNMAFVTPQAAIEDKGKIPFLCEHVLASTNTIHMNASAYFPCPLAIQRRFPVVINVKPKKVYTKEGAFLDGAKVPDMGSIEFPDLWIIETYKVKPKGPHGDDVNQAVLEKIAEYTDLHEFLAWYGQQAKEHNHIQKRVIKSYRDMKDITVCDVCFFPSSKCKCDGALCETCENVLAACNCSFDGDSLHDSDYGVTSGEVQGATISRTSLQGRRRIPVDYEVVEDEIRDNIQSLEESRWIFLKSMFVKNWFISKWVNFQLLFASQLCICVLYFNWLGLMIQWCMGEEKYHLWILNHCFNKTVRMLKFAKMGAQITQRVAGSNKLHMIVAAATVFMTGFMVTKTISGMWNSGSKKSEKEDITVESESTTPDVQVGKVQGISETIGSRPVKTEEEPENVWINNSVELTSFDVTAATRSQKHTDITIFADSIRNNIIHLTVRFDKEIVDGQERTTVRKIKGICLTGNVYMFSGHCIPRNKILECELLCEHKKAGFTANHEFSLNSKVFHFYDTHDVALVELRCFPPKKSILNYFAKSDYGAQFDGLYLSRESDGTYIKRTVKNLIVSRNIRIPALDIVVPLVTGFVQEPTQRGFCGSLLITNTKLGPLALGLHTLGKDSEASSILLDRDELNTWLTKFSFQLEAGEPMLSSPSVQRELTDLHPKSTLRYLEKGVCEVYGSFTGFRPKMKSNVGPTFIQDSMLKRGYTVTHTAPDMKGWALWRRALLDLTDPNAHFDQAILEEAKQGYITDVLSALTQDDLNEIKVYDNFTAVNGMAGYKYVDKMNFNTSMGAPWRTTKKKFIKKLGDQPDAPDAVEFDDEVMDRCDAIIKSYHNGIRYCPVFTGTPKDEPITFEKKEINKVRVFCNSPVDFNIVTRKYYLALVRSIQKNKMIYECAPGTVCQSYEWTEIYEYLTQHGVGQMVAGDYKAYDKRMSPEMILAAFDILIAIAKEAGFSVEDIKVMRGVAIDTSYSFVDFNGDLIQLFGSNPSGHSLTVIINCLVGCLYIRMAYIKLTKKPVSQFKKDVALMKYGDDNIMGVSKKISSVFNHTTMSAYLGTLGITYTMADKTSASVPVIHIKDTSFLKRIWEWDVDVGAYTCPLEHESINKMLTVNVESKSISAECQAIAVISSALREYFFYGKEIFNQKRAMFVEIIAECQLGVYEQPSTLPTWDQCYTTFWSGTKSRTQ